MNGLKVFQIKVHGKYSAEDFDEDLKDVLRRTGCKGEKICFIMDEANVLDSAFLERMNTLLANAEIPGLFEGDEYNALMTGCKEGAQREGLLLDTPEELYRWFTQQIIKNLHVVFTMNPPESGLSSRAAASPALFNRCVLNWMGTWSDQAFFQVGMEFTRRLDLEVQGYQAPSQIPVAYRDLPLPPSHREAVVNAMVFIHDSIHQINADVLQRRGTKTYLTPRHYLDFVNHYVRLYVEKRDDLEEQQRHLNVGLEKLNDTVKKVSELRASLAEKQRQLERTNSEANAKLQQMVADQKETEQKRLASLEIQTALDQQEHAIGERTKIVLEDLANAEPAVEEARKSVSNIKKQHLSEVRAMQNPPEAVKLAMESVCSLLGNKVDGWKSVQAVIRKDDFIASIVNYDNERQMTRSLRAKMQADYLSNPAFTFEIVNRASKACGPLVQWVAAQVNYSAILDRVGPLRDEVKALESQAHETRMKAETITEMIDELEKSIARYKEEYAALISQTQSIKTEMTRVQSKVDRSMKLLDSLSSERGRWDAESKAFEAQIGTLAGDVLLAAAFLSYAGLYDQQYRHIMLERWRRQLRDSGIGFKEQQSMIEYLCTADDKLQWQENSLPNDEVCLENAIILKRFDRYPLIIDPSNRVTEYLVQEFKERKLVLTSFLDDSFVKHLESAIRFGNPILIQDAEHLDPVLNHVLNKEYQKTGGRVLVRLGKQEIDFAPSFRLFLSTRNPTATFSPDVCSRVTFVNFTITKASLRTQSLNQVLKVERPDVDQKRTNLIKAQGEFRLHLRRLERKLLEALNASKGNILDDDVILDTLQTLKSEAADIARKVVKTEEVMVEVQNIMNHYEVIASACTTIYVILEQLSLLNHFYRFSLDYFQDIFKLVLASHHRDGKTPQDRIDYLVNELYVTTFRWTSRSLLHRDHLVLALLLAQAASIDLKNDTFAALLSASLGPGDSVSLQRIQYSNGEEFDSEELEVVLSESRNEWDRFLSGIDSEIHAPKMNNKNQSISLCRNLLTIDQSALAMILVKLFRPDRLMESTEGFINMIFRTDLTAQTDYDFREVVQKTATALTPIALVSVPGYDASYKVEQLVKQANVRCTSIAMGSAEGISQAELALNSATKNGNWIFLKNVHLAPQWLDHLEKRLHGVQPHPDFKLFMTMETNPRVPVNLISMSRVFMFEPPPGIKANITNSLRGLPSSIVEKLPVERVRVYFLLAWLHAVIQERLRYVPLGWSKGYEFTEADFDAAATTIDRWIERAAAGRSNIAPEKIPWLAIGTLLSQCVYGGRVDEEPDQQILSNLITKYFTAKAFDVDFKLTNESGQVVGIPDGSRLESFKTWINKLPEREPPVWLGLPDNSERLLYSEQGIAFFLHWTDCFRERNVEECGANLVRYGQGRWFGLKCVIGGRVIACGRAPGSAFVTNISDIPNDNVYLTYILTTVSLLSILTSLGPQFLLRCIDPRSDDLCFLRKLCGDESGAGFRNVASNHTNGNPTVRSYDSPAQQP
jgi:dynein heavy chain 1, cytosolic